MRELALQEKRHHGRVRLSGLLVVAFGILFVLTSLPWVFVRTLMCTGRMGSGSVCQSGYALPFGMSLFLGIASVFVLLAVAALGAELAPPMEGGYLKRSAHHLRHGYRGLRATHKSHVRRSHWAVWLCMATLFGFWSWFLFFVPPAGAYGITALVVLAGLVLDRRFFSAPSGSSTSNPQPALTAGS